MPSIDDMKAVVGDMYRMLARGEIDGKLDPAHYGYSLLGMRSYVPYQLLIVALHLATAALLRVVARRAGVNAWIATTAATVFVFFGAGVEDIVVSFQITFVGSLVFGFLQLILDALTLRRRSRA